MKRLVAFLLALLSLLGTALPALGEESQGVQQCVFFGFGILHA